MSVNKVILVGNLGADPDARTTNSGSTVVNLRLATTERVKEGDGYKDHTEWHRVVCFGRTAENVAKYCVKGKQLYVEGRLRTRKWTDQAGVEKWSTEVIGDTIRFLGSKDDGGQSSNSNSGSQSYGGSTSNAGGQGPDEDIPF